MDTSNLGYLSIFFIFIPILIFILPWRISKKLWKFYRYDYILPFIGVIIWLLLAYRWVWHSNTENFIELSIITLIAFTAYLWYILLSEFEWKHRFVEVALIITVSVFLVRFFMPLLEIAK